VTEWPSPPWDRSVHTVFEPDKWYAFVYCCECEPGYCYEAEWGPFDTEAEATACGESDTEHHSMFDFYVNRGGR
jgi:hypothetical protein